MEGQVKKMRVELGEPIQYFMRLGDQEVAMNELIGKSISLKFAGVITCIACGKQTKKSFGQGFCYPCFMEAPEASECIIKPELCEAHLGKGRDPEWEKANHLQDHYVYLAASSAIKVGVTRENQIPTRWIDQGASSAIKLAKTPNRYLAGLIEVALKGQMTDKTNWRKMLKNEVLENPGLVEFKQDVLASLDEELRQYAVAEDEVIALDYPVNEYPEKVKSVGFDKLPEITGKLHGIKGQYLLLDDNRVLNIRKHTGYHLGFAAL